MKRGRKEITRISRISKYVIEFWESRVGEREEREWQFRLGKCGCRGAVEARNIQFTRYAFFCPVWHNRGEPNGSPWLTSGGRARGTNYRSNYCGREGRQTKSGSHPCFPFDPLLLASFRFTGHRSIHSIRIYVSN